MNGNVRFGLIGLSGIAKKAAIIALSASPSAELKVIGTSSPEKAVGLPYRVSAYEDVLKNPDIDAVYISLPNAMHEEWTIKSANAGKHIWCEKPAALTYESAERMVTAAKKNNVRLREGFMFRYHPQHKKVREIIESGAVGEISSFEGHIAYPKPQAGNIRLSPELGGGFYYDALVYPIAASRMIFNAEPETATSEFEFENDIDTANKVRLEYTGGRVAVLSGAFSEDYASTYRVSGPKGSIHMSRAYAVPRDMTVKITVETSAGREQIEIPPYDHFIPMVDEVCEEILSGKKTKAYEEDLLHQAKVVEAGWISAKEGRIVRLSEL